MRVVVVLLFLLAAPIMAHGEGEKKPGSVTVEVTPLGDVAGGVASRITFRYEAARALERELALQGSISVAGAPAKTFRYTLRPNETESVQIVEVLPFGDVTIEARLIASDEGGVPLMLGKGSQRTKVVATGNAYVAEASEGAQAILAEGVAGEATGSVRILPPRRDLSPNLFIVEVEVKEPVTRVEFYVEGKKIFTKNASPYRAELDLGAIPRRVEVRVVGYDRKGRYIDADAWIVNERDNVLEAKITRTKTADGMTHVKVSIQNPKNVPLESVVLFAGERQIAAWTKPPYSTKLETAELAGASFLRATAKAANHLEATDLIFLDGTQFNEAIEVNVVEVPVSVVDEKGGAVIDLKREEFNILEDGKVRKIENFNFASNLPLSLGILVDHSGSMETRIKDAREAALKFVTQMVGPDDRAFFGGFSWEATKVSPLVADTKTLRSYIEAMPDAEGATALYDAIVTGLYQFRGIEGRRALVLVTDGEDTASRIDYDSMLNYARTARVPLYFIGIGIGPLGGGMRLKSLAAETGGVAYFVGKIDELSEIYKQLGRELRSQYLLSYYTETSGKSDRRYRKIEVKVKRTKVKVRAPRGFIP